MSKMVVLTTMLSHIQRIRKDQFIPDQDQNEYDCGAFGDDDYNDSDGGDNDDCDENNDDCDDNGDDCDDDDDCGDNADDCDDNNDDCDLNGDDCDGVGYKSTGKMPGPVSTGSMVCALPSALLPCTDDEVRLG